MKLSIVPQKDDNFFLYHLPFFFLCLSAFTFYKLDSEPESFYFSAPLLFFGLVSHLKQKTNLKLLLLKSKASLADYDLCIEVIEKNGWEVIESAKGQKIIAQTQKSWRSWGELVTIIFNENSIFVNSRPSPYKMSSLTTWGKSKKNIKNLKCALKCN
ncbi:hypothetical protein SOPP22_11410 [Shewanella sp. OPT22]|nr:hypothetical protein SOPP22_11410 [Shewanella sp. OPT22]